MAWRSGLVIALASFAVASCNLGFQQERLPTDEIVSDTKPLDTRSDDTTTIDISLTDGTADIGDTTGDLSFDDQNCALATEGVENIWECVGAPENCASMLTVSTSDGSGVVIVCTDAEGLRWYPYIDGEWSQTFEFGQKGDRPIVGSWLSGEEGGSSVDGAGVVRRADDLGLEWTVQHSMGPNDEFEVMSFGDGGSLPFFGDIDQDGQTEFLTYSADSGDIEIMHVHGGEQIETLLTDEGWDTIDIPSDAIFVTPAKTPTEVTSGKSLFAFYDLAEGNLVTLQSDSPDSFIREETRVLDGFGVTMADIYTSADGTLSEELIVCRIEELAILDLETGNKTFTFELAGRGSCLPGIERTANHDTTLLVYVPAAGVMLRHKMN